MLTHELDLTKKFAILLTMPKANFNYNQYNTPSARFPADSIIEGSLKWKFYKYTMPGVAAVTPDKSHLKSDKLTTADFVADRAYAAFDMTTHSDNKLLPIGTLLEFHITEKVKNPPNTKPVDGFKLEMFVGQTGCTLISLPDILTTTLDKCRKLEASRDMYAGEGWAATEPFFTNSDNELTILDGLNI